MHSNLSVALAAAAQPDPQSNLIVIDYSELVGDYEALLIDNDGTVVRSEELHAEIGCRILQENGVPDMTYQERFGMLGFGEAGIWAHLHKQGRAPTLTPAQFSQMQSEQFSAAMAKITDPATIRRPGIKELMEAFKDAGRPVIVVSNTDRAAVIAAQKAADTIHLVDAMLCVDDLKKHGLEKKPHPGPYLHAKKMAGLGVDAPCLAVEDSKTGANSAAAAGLDFVEIIYTHVQQVPHPAATWVVTDGQDVREAARFNPAAGRKLAIA